jgi:hypothetical protein
MGMGILYSLAPLGSVQEVSRRPSLSLLTNPRYGPDYSETLRVIVGSGEKKFVVHKQLVCQKSPFFKSASAKEWEEGMSIFQASNSARLALRTIFKNSICLSHLMRNLEHNKILSPNDPGPLTHIHNSV